MPLRASCSGALASAGLARPAATLSVSAAACHPAAGLKMDVLETTKWLDEELYSRQL